ncbi:MAG: DNA helicase RecQ [Bacteroidota bacterium]|nr:DNA helicase RecQ [Bacteroidota bacterium]
MIEVKKNYSIHGVLKEVFGFANFKGNQEAVIRNIMENKDTFVIMPTGGGKSMCFQLPALMSEGTAIVISPLIALMKNQVDAIRNFGSDDGIAHVLNSSLNKSEVAIVKADLISGKTKLLYVAPESLTKEENIEFFQNIKISFYAIDEAHCISEWGHDFRPEYRRIRPIIDNIGQKTPVIALTATATLKVEQDILKNLEISDAAVFKSSFDRENLYYEVKPKTKNVQREIIKFIKTKPNKSGIIYCLSRKKVEEVASVLQVNGIKSAPYHAGLDAVTRRKNQDDFLMEKVDVIVATIAFGMGIDKPDIRFVIHHDIPKSIEGYYQETGRAGRDGGEGVCLTFYSYADILKLEKFMKGKPVAEQEIAKQLLLETVAYAESAVCRHKQLLHYFGEIYSKENCGACDNCLRPKDQFEGQSHVKKVLECVLEVKQLFKDDHIVKILVGSHDAEVQSMRHDKIPSFGKGEYEDPKLWKAVIRQCLIERVLEKDIETYGLLKITDKGREFLRNPFSVKLVKYHDYEAEEKEMDYSDAESKNGSTDKLLFGMLKDLRKKISRQEELPPFVIFQDPSLEDMAIQYPVTIDEMTHITGVGKGKANKYGEPFINLINEYVEEHDIVRPNDLIVKSIVNKSGIKVYIIQGIDKKLSLNDIAVGKNLTVSALLSEIEKIVSSGTKLDINYYVDELIDDDHEEEIYDYFMEADSDSIEEALLELGEDEFSEEEIRLMRIKFLSEVAN